MARSPAPVGGVDLFQAAASATGLARVTTAARQVIERFDGQQTAICSSRASSSGGGRRARARRRGSVSHGSHLTYEVGSWFPSAAANAARLGVRERTVPRAGEDFGDLGVIKVAPGHADHGDAELFGNRGECRVDIESSSDRSFER